MKFNKITLCLALALVSNELWAEKIDNVVVENKKEMEKINEIKEDVFKTFAEKNITHKVKTNSELNQFGTLEIDGDLAETILSDDTEMPNVENLKINNYKGPFKFQLKADELKKLYIKNGRDESDAIKNEETGEITPVDNKGTKIDLTGFNAENTEYVYVKNNKNATITTLDFYGVEDGYNGINKDAIIVIENEGIIEDNVDYGDDNIVQVKNKNLYLYNKKGGIIKPGDIFEIEPGDLDGYESLEELVDDGFGKGAIYGSVLNGHIVNEGTIDSGVAGINLIEDLTDPSATNIKIENKEGATIKGTLNAISYVSKNNTESIIEIKNEGTIESTGKDTGYEQAASISLQATSEDAPIKKAIIDNKGGTIKGGINAKVEKANIDNQGGSIGGGIKAKVDQMNLNAKNSQIDGDVTVEAKEKFTMTIDKNTKFTGKVNITGESTNSEDSNTLTIDGFFEGFNSGQYNAFQNVEVNADLDESKIHGFKNRFTLNSELTIDKDNYTIESKTLVNKGNITFSNNNPYKTLTVKNYIGKDAHILFNILMKGENNQSSNERVSDQLHANSVKGKTAITLNSIGQEKYSKPILLVKSEDSAKDAFYLINPKVGKYKYKLMLGLKDGSNLNNWYLYQLLKSMAIYAPVGANAIQNMFSMRLCDHNVNGQGCRPQTGGWVRSTYMDGYNQYSDGLISENFTQKTLQAGYTFSLIPLENGQLSFGVMGSLGQFKADFDNQNLEEKAKSRLNSYGLGLYSTYQKGQAYIDGWLQYIWGTNKIHTLDDPDDVLSVKSKGLSASLEFGYNFILENRPTYKILWTPQLQLIYQGVNMKNINENDEISHAFGNNNLQTRLGFTMSLERQKFNPYISINYIHNSHQVGVKNDFTQKTYLVDGTKELAEFKVGVRKIQLMKNLKLAASAAYRFGSNHNHEQYFGLRLQYQF